MTYENTTPKASTTSISEVSFDRYKAEMPVKFLKLNQALNSTRLPPVWYLLHLVGGSILLRTKELIYKDCGQSTMTV